MDRTTAIKVYNWIVECAHKGTTPTASEYLAKCKELAEDNWHTIFCDKCGESMEIQADSLEQAEIKSEQIDCCSKRV